MRRSLKAALLTCSAIVGAFIGASMAILTRSADASTPLAPTPVVPVNAVEVVEPPASVIEVTQPIVVGEGATDSDFGSFLGACNTDADCKGGNHCVSFRKRGNRCTHSCNTDGDCAGGSVARCTKQNRCGLSEPVELEGDLATQ